jgi:hypothetical protein
LKYQNTRRTLTAALFTAAIAGAFGAGMTPSLAADNDAFDGAYARGSHTHLRHARHVR